MFCCVAVKIVGFFSILMLEVVADFERTGYMEFDGPVKVGVYTPRLND